MLSALVFGACPGRRATDHGRPVATLNGRAIGEADFQRYLAQVAASGRRALDPDQRRLALQEFLDETALLEKARRVGIPREAGFRKAVELMETKTLAHLVTERHREAILRDSQVTAAEVEARYHAHRGELLVEPRFSFRQVLVYVEGNPAFPSKGLPEAKAKAKAEEALTALRRGTSWQSVVATFSDDRGNDGRGLIRDGRFGYFAKEVEAAVRTQPLGHPAQPVRSMFGYHVIEVVDRIVDGQPKPFDEVKGMLETRLRDERAAQARSIFMTPIEQEIGLHVTSAGESEASPLDTSAVPADAILATVGTRPVTEADFQWFLKDAWMPDQRVPAYARPGARQSMLRSFLDMLLLEAKARKDGLAQSPAFVEERALMEARLLGEFMRERDKMGARCDCGDTEDERRATQRRYLDRTRAEVGLVVASPGQD